MNSIEYRKYLIRRHEILARLFAIVALVIALIEVGRLSAHYGVVGRIISSPIVLSMLCIAPVVAFIRSRRLTVNLTLLCFCVACSLSLIFNHPAQNYMSTLRFCLFGGMLCLLSPLIDSGSLRQLRCHIWRYSIWLCQILVLMSLVFYLVTLIFTDSPTLFFFISHPILLSTLSAIVALVISYRILNRDRGASKWMLTLDCVSLLAALILTVWAGSRSALLAFIIAEIYILVTNSRKLKHSRWVIATVLVSLSLAAFLGGDVTWRVKKKFEIGKEHNSLIFSRKQLWVSRLEEFKDSPFIGIGFANATRYSTLYSNRKVYNAKADKREEPGSSWLCTLSNTGIVGFGILVFWNLSLLRMVNRRRRLGDISAVKYGALLIFFIVEGFFEGWVLYAGSFMFFLYWLLSSQIYDYRWPVKNDGKESDAALV